MTEIIFDDDDEASFLAKALRASGMGTEQIFAILEEREARRKAGLPAAVRRPLPPNAPAWMRSLYRDDPEAVGEAGRP